MEERTTSQLLMEGIAAARAGDQLEARRLLRRVTELDPGNVDGWIWRASVTENSADKKAFLEEALSLDPENAEARLALERISQREGELTAPAGEEVLFCPRHPDRETMLRCNRCGRPMCTECAVRHPVGLRCRDCVRETRSPIYQVDLGDSGRVLLAATVTGTVVGLLVLLFGGFIVAFGFFGWLIAFMLAGTLGRTLSEVVLRAVPRKRGKAVQVGAVSGLVAGLGLATLALLFGMGLAPHPLVLLIYLGGAIPAVVASLR